MVREASEKDVPRIAELADAKRRQYESYQPVFHRPAKDAIERHSGYLKGLFGKGGMICLVSEEEGVIDGFIAADIRPAPPVYDPGGHICFVDDFVVAGPDKWMSAGKALLDEATKRARERGAVVDLVVCGPRDSAKRDMLFWMGFGVGSEWMVRVAEKKVGKAEELISKTERPHTRSSLALDFRDAGLGEAMLVLVHSSLSSMGWVCGGSVAVIQALMDVVTPAGTIVMPTHSSELSEPRYWVNPPVPESWWQTIRDEMPAFDPRTTMTNHMGDVPEAFRSFPGVRRSSHPAWSFAAWGRQAEEIVGDHPLDFALGPKGPLGKIYDRDGWVFLLGVGHGSNTSLHLAEELIDEFPVEEQGAPIIENGQRVWKTYRVKEYDSDDFEVIGAEFEKAHEVKKHKIGPAETRLMKQKAMVDFAVPVARSRSRKG